MGHATTTDQNGNPEGSSEEHAQDAAAQKRRYVTENTGERWVARAAEADSAYTTPSASDESKKSCKDDVQPQATATTTKSVPMKQEKLIGKVLGQWQTLRVRECYNEVEKEDEDRKSIARQILQKKHELIKTNEKPTEPAMQHGASDAAWRQRLVCRASRYEPRRDGH